MVIILALVFKVCTYAVSMKLIVVYIKNPCISCTLVYIFFSVWLWINYWWGRTKINNYLFTLFVLNVLYNCWEAGSEICSVFNKNICMLSSVNLFHKSLPCCRTSKNTDKMDLHPCISPIWKLEYIIKGGHRPGFCGRALSIFKDVIYLCSVVSAKFQHLLTLSQPLRCNERHQQS